MPEIELIEIWHPDMDTGVTYDVPDKCPVCSEPYKIFESPKRNIWKYITIICFNCGFRRENIKSNIPWEYSHGEFSYPRYIQEMEGQETLDNEPADTMHINSEGNYAEECMLCQGDGYIEGSLGIQNTFECPLCDGKGVME